MTTFGDIRSVVQQRPSRSTWTHLCEALDSLEDAAPGLSAIIDYCQAILSSWPAHIERRAPASWAIRLLEGESVPELCLVTSLDLGSDERGEMHELLSYSTPDLPRLLRDAPPEWFASLNSLVIEDYYLKREELLQLCEVTWFRALDELGLASNGVEEQVIDALVTFKGLRRLDLSFAQERMGLRRMQRLLDANLAELYLSHGWFEREDWSELKPYHEHPGSLRWLGLCSAGLISDGSKQCFASALARQPALGRVEHLDLRFNLTTLDGVMALIDSSQLRSLGSLGVTCSRIGDEGARALATRPGLSRLRHLDLANCGIGSEGLIALSRSPHVPGLKSLEVGLSVSREPTGEKIGKLTCYQGMADAFDVDCMSVVANSKSLNGLVHLGLQDSGLRSEHMQALGHNGALQSLRSLSLRQNAFAEELVRALAEAPLLRQLKRLDLTWCQVSEEGYAALHNSPYLNPQMRLITS